MVLPIKYDPKHRCYVRTEGRFLEPAVEKRVIDDAYKLNAALGYDMNSVEFAIKDGVAYAIDFTNPAPDMYKWSLIDPYFDIVVDELVRFSIKCAKERPTRMRSLCATDQPRHGYIWDQPGAAIRPPPYRFDDERVAGRRAITGG
jgi:hypothetical protein